MKHLAARGLLLLAVALGSIPAGQCVLMLAGLRAPCCMMDDAATENPALPACCAAHAGTSIVKSKPKPCALDPRSSCGMVLPAENLAAHNVQTPAFAVAVLPAPILVASEWLASLPAESTPRRIETPSPHGPPVFLQLRTFLI